MEADAWVARGEDEVREMARAQAVHQAGSCDPERCEWFQAGCDCECPWYALEEEGVSGQG
jgi:hypothetical protein